jgi:hypothetical protein
LLLGSHLYSTQLKLTKRSKIRSEWSQGFLHRGIFPSQLPLLFNFALEYAIKRVQVNQDDLKLNGTHQLLAYADDVNILGGSAHTVKENAEA